MTATLKQGLDGFAEEDKTNIAARTAELIEAELTLRDLEQAPHLTQVRMTEKMGMEQQSDKRLERYGDLMLSTLSEYVAAMCGKLRLILESPNRHPVAIALGDITGGDASKPRPRRRKAKASDAPLKSPTPA